MGKGERGKDKVMVCQNRRKLKGLKTCHNGTVAPLGRGQ